MQCYCIVCAFSNTIIGFAEQLSPTPSKSLQPENSCLKGNTSSVPPEIIRKPIVA